jgi:hypothetical protein
VTQKIQKNIKNNPKSDTKNTKNREKNQKSDTKNRKIIPLIFKFGCILRIIDKFELNLAKNGL